MATASREEARALSLDERGLADRARHPALGRLGDAEVDDLVALLRARRDRARQMADRQRREARGIAPPRGASAAAGDQGTRAKAKFLGDALRRGSAEAKRRRAGR
jgi:hypothetical protein